MDALTTRPTKAVVTGEVSHSHLHIQKGGYSCLDGLVLKRLPRGGHGSQSPRSLVGSNHKPLNWYSDGSPRFVLRLVGPVSAYRDWVR